MSQMGKYKAKATWGDINVCAQVTENHARHHKISLTCKETGIHTVVTLRLGGVGAHLSVTEGACTGGDFAWCW